MKPTSEGLLFGLCQIIQDSFLGIWLRTNIIAIPVADAIHIIAIALVLGTILVVDLRLLGIPTTRWPITVLSRSFLKWTWFAFLAAAITGSVMFIANATTFYINPAFRIKLLLMLLAGVNMFVFEYITIRDVAIWDRGVEPPRAAKIAGLASSALWISVLICGRVIGYTKEVAVDITIPATLDLDQL